MKMKETNTFFKCLDILWRMQSKVFQKIWGSTEPDKHLQAMMSQKPILKKKLILWRKKKKWQTRQRWHQVCPQCCFDLPRAKPSLQTDHYRLDLLLLIDLWPQKTKGKKIQDSIQHKLHHTDLIGWNSKCLEHVYFQFFPHQENQHTFVRGANPHAPQPTVNFSEKSIERDQ